MYLIHNYQHWTSLAIKQANGVFSNQYLLSLVLISRARREKQKSHNQIPEDYFVYILVVYDMLLCITLLLETDMSAVSWEIDANLWRIFICWALHQNHIKFDSLTPLRMQNHNDPGGISFLNVVSSMLWDKMMAKNNKPFIRTIVLFRSKGGLAATALLEWPLYWCMYTFVLAQKVLQKAETAEITDLPVQEESFEINELDLTRQSIRYRYND